MTQSAQSERAQTALKASGLTGPPLMSLEREDALFVLTDDLLIYQDGGGTRRVTLRDLTRIHSDQAGLLRVETPAGTALTASLLGFDVAQVQSFFKGVRSATARAKDLPDSPTPTLGGAKTFGAAPTEDKTGAGQDAAAQAGAEGPVPGGGTVPRAGAGPRGETGPRGATAPEVAGLPEPSGAREGAVPSDSPAASPASSTPAAGPSRPEQAEAEQAESERRAARVPSPSGVRLPEVGKAGGSAENPVVISSSSFSPNVGKPGLGALGAAARAEPAKAEPALSGPLGSDPARPEAAQAEAASPELRKGQTAAPQPEAPADQKTPRIELPHRPTPRSAAAVPGPGAPAQAGHSSPELQAVPEPAPPVTALSQVAAATALARQAETVDALAGRLKLLAAVLFVGALALAFFQFTGGQPLAGLWTLLSGGVGAIALLALGEMSGLLALLGRAPGPLPGRVHSQAGDSGHDG